MAGFSAALAVLAACDARRGGAAQPVLDGDPMLGRTLMRQYGCYACHQILRVAGALGRIGPPLGGWAERRFIAGELPKAPEPLIRFSLEPQSIRPGTAMPDVGATERDARHMAAYLYTLP